MPTLTREELQALVDRAVDELPELSPEQCRRVAAVLHASGNAALMADSVMLTRKEVADCLGVIIHWLICNAREGPDFNKLPGGTIRYGEADLNNWLKQRKVSSL